MNYHFNDLIFYHIYPLGTCNAPTYNNFSMPETHLIEELYPWANYLKDLGINALYLGPLFESTSHGYDTSDYYHVDRRLGNRGSLAKVVHEFHQKGIKVIFDAVFNHVGRNFWAFRDVLEKKENSPYCSWFHNLNFHHRSPYGDPFSYEGWNGHYNLVKLNLSHPEVKKHLFGAVEMWIKEIGADGLRMDAADCLDMNFIKELNHFCKQLKPDFFLKGEIIHGDYRKWVNSEIFDSVTNYECYKGIYSSHNDKNYFEIAYSFNRQFGKDGIYKDMPLYNFVDNHDVNRLASTLNNYQDLYNSYVLLFTMNGLPSIYYGSENAIKGVKTKTSDEPLRPSLKINDLWQNDNPTRQLIKKLANIRHTSKALRYGSYEQLFISNKQFAFIRKYENTAVIVALNASEESITIEVNLPNEVGHNFYELLNDTETQGNISFSHNKIKLLLAPHKARIIEVRK